jgi:hypothetical protein
MVLFMRVSVRKSLEKVTENTHSKQCLPDEEIIDINEYDKDLLMDAWNKTITAIR